MHGSNLISHVDVVYWQVHSYGSLNFAFQINATYEFEILLCYIFYKQNIYKVVRKKNIIAA